MFIQFTGFSNWDWNWDIWLWAVENLESSHHASVVRALNHIETEWHNRATENRTEESSAKFPKMDLQFWVVIWGVIILKFEDIFFHKFKLI